MVPGHMDCLGDRRIWFRGSWAAWVAKYTELQNVWSDRNAVVAWMLWYWDARITAVAGAHGTGAVNLGVLS